MPDLILIDPSPEPIRVFSMPHPFRMERRDLSLLPGVSLAQVVREVQPDLELRRRAHVAVDGEPVAREHWETYFPPAGAHISIRMVPSAAVAGIFVALIAMFAGVAASWAVGGAVIGMIVGGLVSMVVGVLGSLIMKALIPPVLPPRRLSSGQDTPTQFIAGGRNQAVPYGVIPRPYGSVRMVPPLAAMYYTELFPKKAATTSSGGGWLGMIMSMAAKETLGDDQYLRMLVCWGYGPLAISSLRIGETPLENFEEVEVEHRYGYPDDAPLILYSNDIYEEVLSVQLTQSGGWQTRTSHPLADELSLDVTFPNGLFRVDPESGAKTAMQVDFEIGYRPVAGGSWIPVTTLSVRSKKQPAVRKGHRWKVASGQYEVRIRRVSIDYDRANISANSYWSVLRTVTYTSPVNLIGTVALTAIRIKATEQLQGVVDTLNGLVQSILPDWDAPTGTWIERITRNPASIYRDVRQGRANKRPLIDAQLDLERLQYWHEFCDTHGFRFNHVIDWESTVQEASQIVAAAGRASPGFRDQKYSVTIDEPQTLPIFHFTPRNSRGFYGERHFDDGIHAWRVPFKNELENFKQDERFVLNDGYQLEGLDTFGNPAPELPEATEIEQLELPGITHPDLIWKHGRYHLAAATLRRETYYKEIGPEYLIATRGDMGYVGHDVPMFGKTQGRVKAVSINEGGEVTGVTLDELMTMEEGVSYVIRFRLLDQSLLCPVIGAPGETTSLTFMVPIPVDQPSPSIGDLALFGELNYESTQVIIKDIQPNPDLSARVSFLDYAPGVYVADLGPIPAFESKISTPPDWGVPLVLNIISDSSVLQYLPGGYVRSQILINFRFPPILPAHVVGIEACYRLKDYDYPWISCQIFLPTREMYLSPVEDAGLYEIKLRYLKEDGYKGNWSDIINHTVQSDTAPDDVVNFVAVYRYSRLVLVWDKVVDFRTVEYEIRRGASWNEAIIMGRTPGTEYPITTIGTFWVAAMAGAVEKFYSVTPASLIITGSALLANVVQTWDEKATGWLGLKDNCQISGAGNLEAIDLSQEAIYYAPYAHVVDIGAAAQACGVDIGYSLIGQGVEDDVDAWSDVDLIADVDGINYSNEVEMMVELAIVP